MSIIRIMEGSVPADSRLPLFSAKFPSLVDPLKLKVHDSFTQTRAALSTTSPDYASAGQTWAVAGGFTCTTGSDGGYVTGNSSANCIGKLDATGVDQKVFAAIEWGSGDAGFAGLVARHVSSSNTYRLVMSKTVGLQLVSIISNVQTVLYVADHPFVVGQTYLLGLTVDGDDWTIALDNEVIATGTYATPAALAAETHAGIWSNSSGVTHRFKEFMAGLA